MSVGLLKLLGETATVGKSADDVAEISRFVTNHGDEAMQLIREGHAAGESTLDTLDKIFAIPNASAFRTVLEPVLIRASIKHGVNLEFAARYKAAIKGTVNPATGIGGLSRAEFDAMLGPVSPDDAAFIARKEAEFARLQGNLKLRFTREFTKAFNRGDELNPAEMEALRNKFGIEPTDPVFTNANDLIARREAAKVAGLDQARVSANATDIFNSPLKSDKDGDWYRAERQVAASDPSIQTDSQIIKRDVTDARRGAVNSSRTEIANELHILSDVEKQLIEARFEKIIANKDDEKALLDIVNRKRAIAMADGKGAASKEPLKNVQDAQLDEIADAIKVFDVIKAGPKLEVPKQRTAWFNWYIKNLTGQTYAQYRDMPLAFFPKASRPFTRPMIKQMDEVFQSTGLIQKIQALNTEILNATKAAKTPQEAQQIIAGLMKKFSSDPDNIKALKELETKAASFKEQARLIVADNNGAKIGVNDKQKQALVAFFQDMEDIGKSLQKSDFGREGEHLGQVTLGNPQNINAPQNFLDRVYWMANDAERRLTHKKPGSSIAEQEQVYQGLERSIDMGYYNPNRSPVAGGKRDPGNFEKAWEELEEEYRSKADDKGHINWQESDVQSFAKRAKDFYDENMEQEGLYTFQMLVHRAGPANTTRYPFPISFIDELKGGDKYKDLYNNNAHYRKWVDDLNEIVSPKNIAGGGFDGRRNAAKYFAENSYSWRDATRYRGTQTLENVGYGGALLGLLDTYVLRTITDMIPGLRRSDPARSLPLSTPGNIMAGYMVRSPLQRFFQKLVLGIDPVLKEVPKGEIKPKWEYKGLGNIGLVDGWKASRAKGHWFPRSAFNAVRSVVWQQISNRVEYVAGVTFKVPVFAYKNLRGPFLAPVLATTVLASVGATTAFAFSPSELEKAPEKLDAAMKDLAPRAAGEANPARKAFQDDALVAGSRISTRIKDFETGRAAMLVEKERLEKITKESYTPGSDKEKEVNDATEKLKTVNAIVDRADAADKAMRGHAISVINLIEEEKANKEQIARLEKEIADLNTKLEGALTADERKAAEASVKSKTDEKKAAEGLLDPKNPGSFAARLKEIEGYIGKDKKPTGVLATEVNMNSITADYRKYDPAFAGVMINLPSNVAAPTPAPAPMPGASGSGAGAGGAGAAAGPGASGTGTGSGTAAPGAGAGGTGAAPGAGTGTGAGGGSGAAPGAGGTAAGGAGAGGTGGPSAAAGAGGSGAAGGQRVGRNLTTTDYIFNGTDAILNWASDGKSDTATVVADNVIKGGVNAVGGIWNYLSGTFNNASMTPEGQGWIKAGAGVVGALVVQNYLVNGWIDNSVGKIPLIGGIMGTLLKFASFAGLFLIGRKFTQDIFFAQGDGKHTPKDLSSANNTLKIVPDLSANSNDLLVEFKELNDAGKLQEALKNSGYSDVDVAKILEAVKSDKADDLKKILEAAKPVSTTSTDSSGTGAGSGDTGGPTIAQVKRQNHEGSLPVSDATAQAQALAAIYAADEADPKTREEIVEGLRAGMVIAAQTVGNGFAPIPELCGDFDAHDLRIDEVDHGQDAAVADATNLTRQLELVGIGAPRG